MTELQNAIESFLKIHNQYSLRGSFRKSSGMWPVELPISTELEFYYQNFEPVDVKIETGYAPIRLFDLSQMRNAQMGYRWRQTPQGIKDISTWPTDRVVIADDFGGGKPIIALTREPLTPIFANYDTGTPFQIADSLQQFFLALAALVGIVYGQFEIFEIEDDSGLSSSFSTVIETQIAQLLGEKNYERFFDYFYG